MALALAESIAANGGYAPVRLAGRLFPARSHQRARATVAAPCRVATWLRRRAPRRRDTRSSDLEPVPTAGRAWPQAQVMERYDAWWDEERGPDAWDTGEPTRAGLSIRMQQAAVRADLPCYSV